MDEQGITVIVIERGQGVMSEGTIDRVTPEKEEVVDIIDQDLDHLDGLINLQVLVPMLAGRMSIRG